MDDLELLRIFEGLGRPRIGVVGDVMLDRYVWGDVERISPEAPIPVLRVSRDENRIGGAGSVVANLRALEAEAVMFSIVGADEPGEELRELLRANGSDVESVLVDPARRTTRKTRHLGFVQQAHRAVQQILRVDEEDTVPLAPAVVDRLSAAIRARADSLDALLISDYSKGLVTREIVRVSVEAMGGKPVLADPARVADWSHYRGVTLICPNRFEAELASGIPCRELASCERAAAKLVQDLALGSAAITLDRDGILLHVRDGATRHFPTRVRTVADVTGAGDMVLTVLGLALASGESFETAVLLANVAAGIEVRRVGSTPIRRDEIREEMRHEGHPIVEKIRTLDELVRELDRLRRDGKSIVFTNGCFDLLHPGHHHLLNTARREGDALVVAVNSDRSIRRLKGPSRPRIAESDRVKMLAGMEAVDYVILFDDDTPNALLSALRPEVLVKGSEYRAGPTGVVGRDLVESYGGRIAFVDQLGEFSTTNLLGEERPSS